MMQEFIDFLSKFKELPVLDSTQEILLDLEEETATFLREFAKQQRVCLDTLISAILSFQILKSRKIKNLTLLRLEGV